MQRELSESGRMNPTKRASWIVRVTQTNQYNWILLMVIGSAAGVVGVLGLIAGNVPGGLVVLFYGAITAGPSAWWVRRGHPDTGTRVARTGTRIARRTGIVRQRNFVTEA